MMHLAVFTSYDSESVVFSHRVLFPFVALSLLISSCLLMLPMIVLIIIEIEIEIA